MKPSISRIALAVSIAAALSACATVPVQQSAETMRLSHGYVAVALPRVVGTDTPSVTLRAIGGGSEHALTPSQANGEVLSLWVPAGSYEIAEMVGHEKGSYTPIEVKPGHVTDLGGLVWASVGDNQRVLLPLRHKDLSAMVNSTTEPMKAALSPARIEWKPTAPPSPRNIPLAAPAGAGLLVAAIAAYDQEQNKAPLRGRLRATRSLDEFTRLYTASAGPILGGASAGTGALYVASNFGQLRKREASGTWSSIDTGTISALNTVEAGGNRLLVGTHDGMLIGSADNGASWKRLHQFGKQETVMSVNLAKGTYYVLTGSFIGPATGREAAINSLQVYTLDQAMTGQPTLLRKFDLPSKLAWFQLGNVQGLATDNYYMVNAFESVERFDLTARSWKKISPTHNVTHLRSANNGAVLTAFKAQGGFSKLSMSTNAGDSWTPMETPSYPVVDIQMESPTVGYASRWDTGAFSTGLQLTQYDAAAKSWKPTFTAPVSVCGRTVRDASGREQFCISQGGSIFRFGPGKLVPELLAE